jgi:hypothetical protein
MNSDTLKKEIKQEINIGIDNANPEPIWRGIGKLLNLEYKEGYQLAKAETLKKVFEEVFEEIEKIKEKANNYKLKPTGKITHQELILWN